MGLRSIKGRFRIVDIGTGMVDFIMPVPDIAGPIVELATGEDDT